MAGNSKREIIQIESTAGTGYRYSITKNKRLHPNRVEYKKYDPVIRKHVIFKETKYFLTILGDNILFGPTPDGVYAYSMTYYKALAALSDAAPTNWAILNAPDLYMYGALLQAEPFLTNDQRVPLWERGFRQAISDLQEQDNKDRHSGSEMRVMNTSGYF